MPRPSLKEERKVLILDAFERCIVKYGVEGAGLQRIADEAGLARPLLRHHVGNRDELLDEMLERYIARIDQGLEEMRVALPKEGRMSYLLDMLYDPEYRMSDHSSSLYQALSVAANNNAKLKSRLERWNAEFLALIRKELKASYPKADKVGIDDVALGILSLYFIIDAQALLGSPKRLAKTAKSAAIRLMTTLAQ